MFKHCAQRASQILKFQVVLQAITKWQNKSITDPVVTECDLHFLDFDKGQTEVLQYLRKRS